MKDLRRVRKKGCGLLGTSSKNPTEKRVVRCSVCKGEGHNCRNCPKIWNSQKNHKEDMDDYLDDDYEDEYDFHEGGEREGEVEGDEWESKDEGDEEEGEDDDDEMVHNFLLLFWLIC